MARIRTIKPEFPQSESMGRVSRDARLLFIQLWTLCDDSGRTRAASRMLASLLFPYDDDAPGLIEGWLTELERENCVVRYMVDGQTYLQVCNWLIHQKIDRPSASKTPGPEEGSRRLASIREASSEDQGPRTKDQGRDQGPRKGPGKESAPRDARRLAPAAPACPDDIPPPVWQDWLALRARKKAPVTATVLDGARAEAAKAGMPLADFMREWCLRGSQGLKAEWLQPVARGSPVNGTNRQAALEARNRQAGMEWVRQEEEADAAHQQ